MRKTKVDIGGKSRELRFDFNALVQFEEDTGLNVLDGAVWNNMTATSLRALLRAALLHKEPELTLAEVGGWLELTDTAKIGEVLAAVFSSAMPEPSDDPEDKAGKN